MPINTSALPRWALHILAILGLLLMGWLVNDVYTRFVHVEQWSSRAAVALESIGRITDDVVETLTDHEAELRVLRDRSDRDQRDRKGG